MNRNREMYNVVKILSYVNEHMNENDNNKDGDDVRQQITIKITNETNVELRKVKEQDDTWNLKQIKSIKNDLESLMTPTNDKISVNMKTYWKQLSKKRSKCYWHQLLYQYIINTMNSKRQMGLGNEIEVCLHVFL